MAEQDLSKGKIPSSPVALSEEDRIRMRRLNEEIAGRLEEVRLILSRTLNKKVENEAFQISIRAGDSISSSEEAVRAEGFHLKVCLCNETMCDCMEDPPGICYSEPREK